MEEELAGSALPEGTIILGGQYRLAQLLHQRPRVNLYLGRRLIQRQDSTQPGENDEPLVAIRELVLSDLSPQIRTAIEQAAFEEFVSPIVLGSPRLPAAGDRIRTEGDWHYLVMQLHTARSEQQGLPITLADLLLSQRQWPSWLDIETALNWAIQLCRIVARLHRLGVILGDLNPATVLVDSAGAAAWAPILLVSWPPAPQFWPASQMNLSPKELYSQTFPLAKAAADNAFAAPESLGGIYDERSDVYSLGAILYLLLTHYAPASTSLRQGGRVTLDSAHTELEQKPGSFTSLESMELIPPHLLNSQVSAILEAVLLCALALDPAGRFSSVFMLAEALEAIDLENR